jgi:polar amino acid transport system substrate-binding protein
MMRHGPIGNAGTTSRTALEKKASNLYWQSTMYCAALFEIARPRPGRRRRVLLAVLSSMLYLSEGLAAEPRVLVLNDVNEPPYTNAERTGFLDVIATEAFRRAGLELRLVKLPAERALLLANDGVEDGDLTRIAGLEARYPNLIRVPEKLVDWEFAAFSKDASIPASIDAIRSRSVGFIRGWKIYEQAMAGAERVVAAKDSEQLFRLLELDRIEVALYARAMGLARIGKQGGKDVRVLEPSLYKREMFIYLHKRHAGHAHAIAAALRAMKQDGTYRRASDRALLPYFEGRSR